MMKYFTKEQWLGTQEISVIDERARWEQACTEYSAQLQLLRPRLTVSVFDFFEHANIHDGELIHLDIIDGSRIAQPGKRLGSTKSYPVRVELHIMNAYNTLCWKLNYHTIKRVLIDFPSDSPLFYAEGDGFHDIGYHELTDAGNGFLRHEILFSTGSSILIEFQDISIHSQST